MTRGRDPEDSAEQAARAREVRRERRMFAMSTMNGLLAGGWVLNANDIHDREKLIRTAVNLSGQLLSWLNEQEEP